MRAPLLKGRFVMVLSDHLSSCFLCQARQDGLLLKFRLRPAALSNGSLGLCSSFRRQLAYLSAHHKHANP